MKKKFNFFIQGGLDPRIKKTLMYMRLTCLIILLGGIQAFAVKTYAQTTNISVNLKNATVEAVLQSVEEQTDFYFLYSRSMVDVERKVDLSVKEVKVTELLNTLFSGTGISWKIDGRQIVLSGSEANTVQQQITVTGKVTDSSGLPLPGVTVVVKGTTQGIITDFDGKYSLSNVPADATLVFSFVGMKMQEVSVTGKTTINVKMEEETVGIEEVVAVGYGTQTKRNVTGSISKVSMAQTEDLPNVNINQSLRGRVAGVQFTDNGRPGQDGSILIRGPRSLSAGNSPLIILDGVYYNGSLGSINPNDIKSIEVLKDASAAAIYGSRAANGVILITSKRGESEKPMISISTFMGTSDWSSRLKLLSPERYIQKSKDVRIQKGMSFDPNDPETYLTLSEAENYRNDKTIDPYEEISQTGRIISTDLNISGKTKYTNYFISGSFFDEKGLIYNDNMNRISLRTNLEFQINTWLTVGTNSIFSSIDESGKEASISTAPRQSPYGTWYYDDGLPTQYTVPEDEVTGNPIRDAYLTKNKDIYNSLIGNFFAFVNIPYIKNLTYRINYSKNLRWINDYSFDIQDPHVPNVDRSNASKRNWNANDWVLENILKYDHEFNEDHAFDITLMYGLDYKSTETTTANSAQFSSDILGWNCLELGSVQTNTSDAEETTGVSTMARLNYRYKNKYLVTMTARNDGSSVFAENKKYATFPSVALSWIASEENFMKGINFIDLLKFRVSHGAVGNQAISPYQSLSLASVNHYVLGNPGSTYIGIYPSNISNADLKWETTYISNIALDFNIFKGRLGGTLELYNMKTNDLLVERSIPTMTGYESIWTNLGETNNKGVEITLNTTNVRVKKFQWDSDIVFSHNKNKIVHLYGSDTDMDGKEDNDIANGWFIGQPIDAYYDYIFDGIYQEGDQMPTGYQAGFARFKDLNGDGKVEAQNDRTIVGQGGQPKFRWGITNTFKYENFQLQIFINAMQGWIGTFNRLDHFYGSIDPFRPTNMMDAGWWTTENKSNTRPSLVYNRSVLGHNWYLNRNFIRIQDVSLSYNLPSTVLSRMNLSSLRIIVSGKNLLTFTDWLGTNPETITEFPLGRSINIGLKLGF